MYLKSDFESAITASAASYPDAKAALNSRDPLFMASLDAMATMLTMVSAQIDIAQTEWVTKARDGTVLADAALRGILPLAKPARVTVLASNAGLVAVAIAAGRVLVDGKGRPYRVEGAATVPAGGTVSLTLRQISTRVETSTVAVSSPFMQIQLPDAAGDGQLVGISVADASDSYVYTPDFFNVEDGAKVYAVEVDEYRQVWLRFGADGVMGYQPAVGDVLTMTVSECMGKVDDLSDGAAFGLESLATTAEGYVTFALTEVVDSGANPPDIAQLRTMARYQGIHDDNPVYRGQWDFHIRKHLGSNVLFLSVWNEQVEEQARGADVDNINRLFVAAVVDGQATSATQASVESIIKRADDGYRITHVTPRECQIPVTVTASVPAIHDPGDVEAQIRATLLAKYGRGSSDASRGLSRSWRQRDAHDLLGSSIAALQDSVSDYAVVIGSYGAVLPEDWQYMSDSSISVTVTRVTDNTQLWTA